MNHQPNEKEAALIQEIQRALEKFKKPDRRAGGDFYFVPESVAAFQDLALKVAIIISDQKAEETSGPILAVAAEIKKLDDIEWNHPNSIGRAFERGAGADVVMTTKPNPLSNVKLPPTKGPLGI